jgi:hypothetical protein
VVKEETNQTTADEQQPAPGAEIVKMLKSEISVSKQKRDDLVDNWQRNVDERRGKNADAEPDSNRSMVPIDWTVTKTKAGQLWSQMPAVRLSPKHQMWAEAVPVFAKVVNDIGTKSNVEAVMSESVVDCINAAGVGAAIVRYEALTEQVPVSAVDTAALLPEQAAVMQAGVVPTPKINATRITSRRFVVDRISPSDLLWPDGFRRSDWDKAPWLGHTCREPWAKAKRLLNLSDDDKEKVLGASRKRSESLSNRSDAERKVQEELVEYDEIFYWRDLYHEDEKYYDAIQRVVFVAGLDEPVINEPWKGQKFNPQTGTYTGSCIMPIRILTLTYISDEAIPPSDHPTAGEGAAGVAAEHAGAAEAHAPAAVVRR